MNVHDILALESEIMECVALKVDSDAVLHNQEASAFLKELALSTTTRHARLVELSRALGSGAGVVKEVVAANVGVLTGLYENVVSMLSRVRCVITIPLTLTCTAYSMLYTTGAVLRSEHTATIAPHHLSVVTPLVMKLSCIILGAVVTDLSVDFRDLNQEAFTLGRKATASALSQHGESEVA